MKKWTTTGHSGTSVTLHTVLESRGGPLNEVECWSLLSQTGHALQDLLLSINGRRGHLSSTASLNSALLTKYRSLTVTPFRLLCTSTGKVELLDQNCQKSLREFQHPLLSHKADLDERELEAIGIYSLAKTIEKCLTQERRNPQISHNPISDCLKNLLFKMTELNHKQSTSLLELLCLVSERWPSMVGSSPISRFISQLCKVTLGWHPHMSCSSIALTNHDSKSNVILDKCLTSDGDQQLQLPPPQNQIEFSRLDTSSSSSFAEEDSSSTTPPSSPISQNNNEVKIGPMPEQVDQQEKSLIQFKRGQYGRRLEYKSASTMGDNDRLDNVQDAGGVYENVQQQDIATPRRTRHSEGILGRRLLQEKGCSSNQPGELPAPAHRRQTLATVVKSHQRVQRNPSRLYRVVKPLTNIDPMPSPATKRCVGPEFVVMAAETSETPIFVDLASHVNSRKDNSVTKKVRVVALNGQKLTFQCSPFSITAGEILDNVLSQQDLKESCYYSLALKREDEYWTLSSDSKLHKVAPPGWKESYHKPHINPVDTLELYLRFRFLPDDLNNFKDSNNKHQFYLQLRRDVLEARYNISLNDHLTLAALALQTEFGDFSEDIHGDGEYFLLEHYLPLHVIRQMGEKQSRAFLAKLHRAHLGQSQGKTELKFVKELQRSDNFGFHFYSVRETKKPTSLPKRHIGIHLQGIFLFETSRDKSIPHKILASSYWQNITRIQYDKSRFQLSVRDADDPEKTVKMKFYVSDSKSKLMFDLASAHHQFYSQQRWSRGLGVSVGKKDERVEYREPRERAIRSLKNRFRKQASQKKLYTKGSERAAMKRSAAVTAAGAGGCNAATAAGSNAAKLMVKRLTHYTSMADALAKDKKRLNTSDKENETPNIGHQNYR